MMHSSILFVVAVIGVALPQAQACTYWCMNPVTTEYECCDGGNPWYKATGEIEEPVDAEVVVVDYETPVEDVDNSGSSGCVYWCYYNEQAYCCDHGENPIPTDHEDNAGRCPTEEEQSCKFSSASDKKRNKKPVAKMSRLFVDKHDQMCASDGYCGKEQKCCPSKCHKKHTCMPSF